MRVGIATDHGGFSLKEELIARLRAAGHEIVDFGAHALNADDDYPDFVVPLAKAVIAGRVQRGVAICGSGVGPAVAWDLVQTFLTAEFSQAERHLRRLGKVARMEAQS
jgi:ribose 5-phosphate isomerase B